MCRINGKSVAIGEQATVVGNRSARSCPMMLRSPSGTEIFLQVPVIGLLLGNREGVFLRTK